MIPKTLDGWDLALVEELLRRGVFESDLFDFKEMLPPKSDDKGKTRTKKTCAAFANSAGGFLIYGVRDTRGASPSDRLVGLSPDIDFPTLFGSYPAAIEPAVEWSFRTPSITLESGKLLHVIFIPPSVRRPHALREDDRWWFCKRTSKGNESMSYEEVRMAFQDTENRRSKLSLLISELDHIDWVAERLLREVPEPDTRNIEHLVVDYAWTTRYPTGVVDIILGDAFSLIAGREDLWVALVLLRDETRRSNEVATAYSNYEFIKSTANPQQRKKLYLHMRSSATEIRSTVRHAKKMVSSVLSGGDKLWDPAARSGAEVVLSSGEPGDASEVARTGEMIEVAAPKTSEPSEDEESFSRD